MEPANKVSPTNKLVRCAWVGSNTDMITYHDTEWGVPLHDERKLFEFMALDAFQAGLSWQGVLSKRSGFESAFAGFHVAHVAKFTEDDVLRLMQDKSIIRNQQKIRATINNARAVLQLEAAGLSLSKLLWQFVDHRSVQNNFHPDAQIPAQTEVSQRMSIALKERGFSFVGPTICYAYMQAAGLVNDHTTDCFRHNELCQPTD